MDVDKPRNKETGGRTREVKIENERFTVVSAHCRYDLEFKILTLSFGKLRKRM